MDCLGGEDEAGCSGRKSQLPSQASLSFLTKMFDTCKCCAHDANVCVVGFFVAESAETNTASQVFLSSTTTNDERCLFHPVQTNCSSISFVINKILSYDLWWIDTLYIDDYSPGDPDAAFVQERPSKTRRNLTMTCVKSCTLSGTFVLCAKMFVGNVLLLFKKIRFESAVIVVQNFHVIFDEITFVDTKIIDKQGRPGEFDQVTLVMRSVKFLQSIDIHENQILLQHTFSTSLRLQDSDVTDTSVVISAGNCWFRMTDTSTNRTHISIRTTSTTVASLTNVSLQSTSNMSTDVLDIRATQLQFEIVNSVVARTSGGIKLLKEFSGFQHSWSQVKVENCMFSENLKGGSGAAMHILFYISETSTSNHVHILNSSFVQNAVHRVDFSPSYGGALSVHSYKTESNFFAEFYVDIENSSFINNKADDGGGAVYVSDNVNGLKIVGSSFLLKQVEYVAAKAMFMLSNTITMIDRSSFNCQIQSSDTSLIEIQMLAQEDYIQDLNMHVKCLSWNKLQATKSFGLSPYNGERVMQKFILRCSHCSQLYFVPTDGAFIVSFKQNISAVQIKEQLADKGQNVPFNTSNTLECIKCPYGGDCPGVVVTSKPNFWGLKHQGKIYFYPCPIGYCCSGSSQSPCRTYNQCNGHRAGVLCGTCEKGYSLSLMSDNCVKNNQCNANWFWPVGILAATLYMLWYTFKDDVLDVPQNIITKRKSKTCEQETQAEQTSPGYFGILIYFVQTASLLRLSVSQDETKLIEVIMQKTEKYINLVLSIELSDVSYDLCPFTGITLTQKVFFKCLFLCGVYLSWCLLYLCYMSLTRVLVAVGAASKDTIEHFKAKLIKGLVEIVKYTYGGLAAITFYSLTCVSVSTDTVWLYDGTVKCFNKMQTAALVFCVGHIIIFPFSLPVGLKLLGEKSISSLSFLIGCIVPLPFLAIWTCVLAKRKLARISPPVNQTAFKKDLDLCVSSDGVSHDVRHDILDGFQAAYRTTDAAKNWESVIILRRLLLSLTSLIPNSIIQLSCCIVLCLCFLVHHLVVKPFKHDISNQAETFSLALLVVTAAMNVIKSNYIQMGIIPDGPNVNFLRVIGLSENTFIIALIFVILVLEAKTKCNESKARITKQRMLTTD